jgi:hypothetical protein
MILTPVPTTAETEKWTHGQGTLSHTEAQVPDRSVEVWYASDGRYRVKVETLDGSLAGEEVAFDGVGQTVVITDPVGNKGVLSTDGKLHFAVQLDDRGGLKSQLDARAPNGQVTSTLVMALTQIEPDPDLLLIDMPKTTSVTISELKEGPEEGTRATGSNSTTFYSVYDFGQCVWAYNYRNTSTDYFYASSSSRGNCLYMSESLWEGYTYGTQGTCGGFWLASGTIKANYSNKWTYNGTDGTKRCSNHAGWHPNWYLGVPWYGLNAATN